MPRGLSVCAIVIALPCAVVSALWLAVATPADGLAKVGLYLVLFLSVVMFAAWACGVLGVGDSRGKRIASALAAGVATAGLLATILSSPAGINSIGADSSQKATSTPGSASPDASLLPGVPSPFRSATPSPTETASPDQVDLALAYDFFTQKYFPSALDDAGDALETLGTPDFREQKRQSGVASFVKFYDDTLAIPAEQVRIGRHGSAPDTFDVRFLRVLKNETTDRVATIYALRCASPSPTSTYRCPVEDLRVQSSRALR